MEHPIANPDLCRIEVHIGYKTMYDSFRNCLFTMPVQTPNQAMTRTLKRMNEAFIKGFEMGKEAKAQEVQHALDKGE